MPMPKHLNRIGMRVFISEYEYFATRPKRSDAIAYLVDKGISNEAGAGHRVSGVKYLFDDPILLREALEYIAHASLKATMNEKEKAVRLLKEFNNLRRR